MSPYHVQIDSLSLLPLRLQKNDKYDLKKSIPPIRRGS